MTIHSPSYPLASYFIFHFIFHSVWHAAKGRVAPTLKICVRMRGVKPSGSARHKATEEEKIMHQRMKPTSSVKSGRVIGADFAPKAMIAKSRKPSSPKPRRVSDRNLATKANNLPVTIRASTGSKRISAPARSTMSPPPPIIDDPRIAMLKSRFAGTILKAQTQLFGENEAKHILKKCKTEELRSRAAVQTLMEEKKTTRRREKKCEIEELRRAAREALEKVERSVVVNDSHKSVKDLERLCGFAIPYVGGFLNRMHYYGLYLKN